MKSASFNEGHITTRGGWFWISPRGALFGRKEAAWNEGEGQLSTHQGEDLETNLLKGH